MLSVHSRQPLADAVLTSTELRRWEVHLLRNLYKMWIASCVLVKCIIRAALMLCERTEGGACFKFSGG